MSNSYLYSIVLDLQATTTATIPATMGHQTHALFLDLVNQSDPALAARLHEEPGYRPFTVSPLFGGQRQGNSIRLQECQPCRLRVTLLDGGALWQCLSARFLTAQPIILRLGEATLRVNRILSHPADDAMGWARYVDWQTLASVPGRRSITLRFVSPTAFSLGEHRFALFPEPELVWDSLMRVWNTYAPDVLKIEKGAVRAFIKAHVQVNASTIEVTTLRYPKHIQKGFTGTCSYLVQSEEEEAARLTALAEFACYAGIGSKTTMGMGQVRAEETPGEQKEEDRRSSKSESRTGPGPANGQLQQQVSGLGD